MKHRYFFLIYLFSSIMTPCLGSNNPGIDQNTTLRIDFVLTGNHVKQQATISDLFRIPGYSGSAAQNIPTFDYGNYKLTVTDKASGDTLFLKGFCTLFGEWQSTSEAKDVSRAFKQTIEMPFPKTEVTLLFQHRKKNGSIIDMLSEDFSPEQLITTLSPQKFPSKIIHGNDHPHQNTDLLIIAEGYRKEDSALFFKDANKLSKYLLNTQPFEKKQASITIRALAVPSLDSGTDNPGKGNWKNTAMNSSFNTFGTDRYLETLDTWSVFNYAAALPHDHIIVLVNSKKYGGGGVYNHFSIATARHKASPEVFVHELGHGLAGLGDEYYYSETAYSEFFSLETEPWQPNLTTLIDFDSKWKFLLEDSIPIPTPDNSKYRKATGVFEGGGYSAKGIYRPAINCRMKSNEAEGFCKVCQFSIKKILDFYTQ
ncbi:M64 family metallopeptidase [Marinilabilia rubra]|uniref:Peptidase M64 n=1 Tax=Marinilabilia rubra TaxID=2162893 RepID=A0A2U2B4Y7_9BACT|nr:M64 family metallopeptidase [Marinilabilia rubra]PWD98122.1 peptidase M64 [Marinilabilia rubra]